ncbi:MAG: S8 family serine peptidase [Candidatus Thermoplasmatota archaeon]|nr:S8 family serine peptidase [Candidatus Thermoplasmatota archaeon]
MLVCAICISSFPSEGSMPTETFVDSELLGILESGTETGENVVVITYRNGMEDEGKRALDNFGFIHHDYSMLPMSCALVSPLQIRTLMRVPEIDGIFHEEIFTEYLDASAPYIGANVVWNTYGDTGNGAVVMIIDSGIDGTHPDLTDRIIQNAVPSRTGGLVTEYAENMPNSDLDGHGTHVAGIVAGTGEALGSGLPAYRKYMGIAHGASIVGFGAGFDPNADESTLALSALVEGFNYAIEKKDEYGIRVISNSWGSSGEFDPKSPIAKASFECYKAGIAVFFAAGNEGPNEGTMNRHSVAPWVLSVAAGDFVNNIAEFSSRGTDAKKSGLPYDHPDITAPGVGITATKALLNTNLNLLKPTEALLYTTMSGTSMACPHVAGTAALILSANDKLSPDQIYDILTGTATPIANYNYWETGSGYLNALEAYRLSVKTEGNIGEFLSGNMKYGGPATNDYSYSQDSFSVGYGKASQSTDSGSALRIGDFTIGYTTLLVFGALILVLVLASFRIEKGRAQK